MTAPVNMVNTTTLVGQREDLEDVIHRVAPEDRPFTKNIGKTTAKARYHEHQTETLATPDPTNTQLEGDDYVAGAPNNPSRIGNYEYIAAKAFTVSATADVVDKAGRDTETARHKVIRGIELERDFEARMIGNYPSSNESGATTRKGAGALAWIVTNDSRGAGGADGGFAGGVVAAATPGTLRTFTESLVKAVMANLFNSRGGSTSRGYQAYMSGTQKQQWSAFTGITAQQTQAGMTGMTTILGAADTYISDFGKITLIPHPYGLTRDVLIIDPDMWAIATLRGVSTKKLGDTGDAEKWLITQEKTLVSRNERASTAIYDVQ